MSIKNLVSFSASLGLMLIAGCGGGGGDSSENVTNEPKVCQSISGGGTTATVDQTQCPGCSVSSPENAIDGDFDTAASFTAPSTAGGFAGLRVTAQSGVVFGAGTRARATIAFTGVGRNETAASTVIRTYLSGELQEQATFETNVASPTVIGGGGKKQYSISTSEPFDAVAFGISGFADGVQIDYFEYCSD